MNAEPNFASFRMHELTRSNAMQAADRVRLAHEATGHSPVQLSDLLNRPSLRIAIALVITVILLAAASLPASAQDMIETGNEPSHPGLVSFRVGIYYQINERHSEAIAEFSATVEAFPMIAEAWSARADSYLALGEFDLAIADYNAAVELAPNLVSALAMRGDAYRLSGSFDEAIADYSNAIGQMPEYAVPHAGLAAAFEALGQHDDAIAEYSVYLDLAGEEADPLIVAHVTELTQVVMAKAK